MQSYISLIRNTRLGAGEEGAVEISYYGHLQSLIQRELNRDDSGVTGWRIEINFGVEGTFPDFSIYDCQDRTVARIEAKRPDESLEQILANHPDQLKKYLDQSKSGHPHLYITNFLSFQKVQLVDNVVEMEGNATTIIESENALLDVDLQALNLEPLIESFRQLIQQITQLEPQEVNSINGLNNLLGQVMWASGSWIDRAARSDNQQHIGFSNHNLANSISDLATNLIIRSDGGGDEIVRSSLIGQLFAVGLIMNERRARIEESQIDEQLWGDFQQRLNRRRIDCDLIPSTRLSRIIRLMYCFREEIGILPLVDSCQDALMRMAPEDILEFRGLEAFLIRFMRSEFDDWVTQYGLVPTPAEAIQYMVSRANQALMEKHSDNPDDDNDDIGERGIMSLRCQIIDPATGGGHYYIEILRRIYSLAMEENGLEIIARQHVRQAIGCQGNRGRVHAVDIQPMCVILTHIHLAEFCEEHSLNIENLEPRIYLGDTLVRGGVAGLEVLETDYQHTMYGRKHLAIGNPPWGSFENAEGVDLNQGAVDFYLEPFRGPFKPIMQDLTGNDHVKLANKEISYAFFSRFARGRHPAHEERQPVVCLLMPMVMTWSASWAGMREWILDNGHLTLDNVGGSIFPVNRDDGANIFGRYNVSTGNAIYTFIRRTEDRGVRALDLWCKQTTIPAIAPVEEGDVIGQDDEGSDILAEADDVIEGVEEHDVDTRTASQKLTMLRNWSNALPNQNEYEQEYVVRNPRFSYFRPRDEGFLSSPMIAELFWPGENYSGMETIPGDRRWRLIDANAGALESAVHDVLQYATYDEAVAAGGRNEFIAKGLGQDDAKSRRNFGLIKAFDEVERYRYANIAICSMVNLRAYVPRRLVLRGGTEMETLKCWKALRLHQIEIHEDHRGFFGIPDSLDGPQTLDSGYQCAYLSNYPGYKHAAGKKNGRAIPVVVHVTENEDDEATWAPNINPEIAAWLNENYDGFNSNVLTTGEVFWDYVLAISCSDIVQNDMIVKSGYELNIPFPQDYEIFQRISRLGEFMRIMQTLGSIGEDSDYYQLQQAVYSVIQVGMCDANNANVEVHNFRITDMKADVGLTSRSPAVAPIVNGWNLDSDEFNSLIEFSGLNQQDLLQILGEPQRVCIDHVSRELWLTGVPRNVLGFTIGNTKVLQTWLAIHSDLTDENSLQCTTWTNLENQNNQLTWYTDLCAVIRNITIMMILRPTINQISEEVVNDIMHWAIDEEE